ncbi:hypothetical protein [Rehaibacterium terrae]|jgi:hypothetical protein|uniref:Lipoprotein n=1 Tax=Rehaibacterium terrae TaxID=1341696 RepID=A0A7W7Y0U9_9GAMM|nr:hypothetical protein [Rehaibacterium terrae]MBB5016026.1 hypothetical protein [Rehaibacterium terrae]
MKSLRVGVAAALVMVAGCSGSPARPEGGPLPYRPTGGCAPDLSQVQPQPLIAADAKGRVGRVDFRALAQCLTGEDGEAEPVVLFQLGDREPPFSIEVVLFADRDSALAAAVEILDGGFGTLDRHGFDSFTSRNGRFTLTTFVNDRQAGASYLLLRPDRQWLNSQMQLVSGNRWTTVWSTGAVMGAYSDGTETTQRLVLRDDGKFTVEVKAYAPKTLEISRP